MEDTPTFFRALAAASEPFRHSTLLSQAIDCALEAHHGQRRKGDRSEFITHPLEVGEAVAAAGYGEEVVAAALLHDVVEDSELRVEDVRERFGEQTARLVEALTEDGSIADYAERKREHRARVRATGPEAVAIYAADKLSNLRDARRGYATEGEAIGERFKGPFDVRMLLWHEDLEMARATLPGLPYLRELRYELESLEEERSSRRDGGPRK